MIKTHAKLDSSNTEKQLRVILEDAVKMSKEQDKTFRIGEDDTGNIITTSGDDRPFLFACGFSKDTFFDNVAYASYTIDEIIPRACKVLLHGIIEYGDLGFLSEGRAQLSNAQFDTHKLVKKYNKAFILGMSKKSGIMIAPASEKSRFVAPRAVMVTLHGAWSISDIHSTKVNGHDRLYIGIGYGVIEWQIPHKSKNWVFILENAFEDAAHIATYTEKSYFVVLGDHTIVVQRDKDDSQFGVHKPTVSVKVDPGEFFNGDDLALDQIKDAAKNAYEIFLPEYLKTQKTKR